MGGLDAEGAGNREERNVATAKAMFRELESKLDELGRGWESDLQSSGIPMSDSRDAVRKLNAIRSVVTKNRSLAEKPHLFQGETEHLVSQSSTFTNSISYVNYLLGKKREAMAAADTFTSQDEDHLKENAKQWIAVKNAASDIRVLLDTLAAQNLPSYPSNRTRAMQEDTDAFVIQAEQIGNQRDAALKELQQMLDTLRKDALALQYEKEHAADAFPQM